MRGPRAGPPKAFVQLVTRVSNGVSAGWSWYDESQGIVEWSFENSDMTCFSGTPTTSGYSPDPSTFTLTEVLAESGAPYDILPFRDTYADGQCPQ